MQPNPSSRCSCSRRISHRPTTWCRRTPRTHSVLPPHRKRHRRRTPSRKPRASSLSSHTLSLIRDQQETGDNPRLARPTTELCDIFDAASVAPDSPRSVCLTTTTPDQRVVHFRLRSSTPDRCLARWPSKPLLTWVSVTGQTALRSHDKGLHPLTENSWLVPFYSQAPRSSPTNIRRLCFFRHTVCFHNLASDLTRLDLSQISAANKGTKEQGRRTIQQFTSARLHLATMSSSESSSPNHTPQPRMVVHNLYIPDSAADEIDLNNHPWMMATVIDDDDLMFGGKPLCAWYEEDRRMLSSAMDEEETRGRQRERSRADSHEHHQPQHHQQQRQQQHNHQHDRHRSKKSTDTRQ